MNKLGKLPELADNIKRRMSDQLKPVNPGPRSTPPGSYAPTLNPQGTPNDSDDDDNSDTMSDFTTTRRTSMFLQENKSKNNSGAIFVLSRRKKQFYCKWCVLGEGLLKWFNEDTSLARPKETIMLSNIFSLTKRTEKHIGTSQQELYCFDIAVVNSKGKFCVYMLGLESNLEREVWMEKIVQSLGSRLSTFSMVGCKRIGWAYLKAGFAAEWSLAWLYLADRYIVYATQDSIEFEKIDLKKTKDVFVRKDSKNLCLPLGFTNQPVLVCDFNDRSLYILLGVVDEVEVWRSHIEDIAFTNNNILADQQVTHEDVPVIVDKCVKFVFSHGVMTEGIYRLAGVNTKINKLLSQFRSNAWAVQISRENFSEHDVANVLKRFVRQLDNPLLTHSYIFRQLD
ncbi:arf-GAP with Rho-GAP domain, ANK repeat and PH domain-containing protein 1 [Eurytemora carolleeae]|uniref:arf-GAP with Rho-GAP domain, ANK repeat and PH domain-containing protein 1 n=1 Tax=Eurytemora carolleeae TaxID=1294199 RepID=UPI000C7922A6|nr:arf-GAP with Rho-GAP domain, ANK repeat and PH domain-containing protein 1 [Eurytemora carolleeae]|eukprot:XP_023322395.1 arf-GAP with Rho-GAP domain, ANK repeat and PH domain-containing protein 1-like [Eurytemora affinis]